MASPFPCEERWQSALVNYGLERPSENTEIHEEIWIFGALCLYWCDVELHIYPIWFLEIQFWERKFLVLISGDSFWERRFLF